MSKDKGATLCVGILGQVSKQVPNSIEFEGIESEAGGKTSSKMRSLCMIFEGVGGLGETS
jgi:hypothetical protein